MSTAVLPSLAGLGYDIGRTPIWSNQVQEAVSGKETRIALWSYPRWQWDLVYNVLRQGTIQGTSYTEFATLSGFFNQMFGGFDSFLYSDQDDNSVTAQAIGIGDGSTKTFQLVRSWGGFVEPVLAPNVVSHVYDNGVDSGGWSVSSWGSSTPGVVTYVTAPASGHVITATFTYYFPVRFTDDKMSFAKMMQTLYDGKKVSFISLKN